ncbi:MAG TPA: hypothetical protein VGH73_06075 [Thermoanaerobaculia bacterium]
MRALKRGQTLALAALVALTAGAAAPAQRQDLHGAWRLNEDITARMRESQREGRVTVEGGLERRGGMGGPRGPGGSPAGGGFEDPKRIQRDGDAPSFAALSAVTIEQTPEKVTITDADGHPRVYWTDNRKVRDEKLPDGPAEVRAKWDENGSLAVQVLPAKGPRRTETWTVSNDRKLLYLSVEVEGGRQGMKIRRAYDAVAAGQPREPKKPETPPAPPDALTR